MSWKYSTASDRIRGFMKTTPTVRVEKFESEYLPRRLQEAALAKALGSTGSTVPPLFDLPDGAAVLVEDAVHVYVRAVSYDDVRLENGRETEASHARGLSFLHLLYSAADRSVEAIGAQRVDHHGARMHAVVAEPAGAANLALRIARAFALAKDMTDLARESAGVFARELQFPLRFRIGMDVGTCVAMNSGRRDDREPVFIGPSANHAAKLAAGDAEGVYMSDRVRAALGLPLAGAEHLEALNRVSEGNLSTVLRYFPSYDTRGTVTRLQTWDRDIKDRRADLPTPAQFKFVPHSLPLSTIDYADLSPSRSIRMPLASIFADLDEYTRYIDRCVHDGCLPTAVRLLHILRSEFDAVLQTDFKGRKVRFIGDCIHGVIADGTGSTADEAATVKLAALCAGGLRSSFNVCQDEVEHADQLGLAIGFELGQTPISRIGIRGDRSVRVASSLATRASERLQQSGNGVQTVIGPRAYDAGPPSVRKLFGSGHIASDLTYDDVATAGGTPPVSAPRVAAPSLALAAAAVPSRAYLR